MDELLVKARREEAAMEAKYRAAVYAADRAPTNCAAAYRDMAKIQEIKYNAAKLRVDEILDALVVHHKR
jgi:predicted NAD-dependent protein-ADP-ribosyltransferase YbiA (DUF1768 family)